MVFDPEFIQEAVSATIRLLADRGSHGVSDEFEQKQKDAVSSADPRACLEGVYRGYFEGFGIEKAFQAITGEFPLLESDRVQIRVSLAYGRHQEGPEMIRDGANKMIILRIQARRFLNHGLLQTFLRHCFLKAQDMVDPNFGYSEWTDLEGRSAEENDRLNDLFEDLWDESIRNRLGYEACLEEPKKLTTIVFFTYRKAEPDPFKNKMTRNDLIEMAIRKELRQHYI